MSGGYSAALIGVLSVSCLTAVSQSRVGKAVEGQTVGACRRMCLAQHVLPLK